MHCLNVVNVWIHGGGNFVILMQYFDHDVVAYLAMGLGDDLGPILDSLSTTSVPSVKKTLLPVAT